MSSSYSDQNHQSAVAAKLQEGMRLHQDNKIQQAEICYIEILAQDPCHFDANQLLGILRSQQGRNEEALALMKMALRTNPQSAPALSNMGLVLSKLGRPADAVTCFDLALAIKPDHAETHKNRGAALRELGRPLDAVVSYELALVFRPDDAEAHNGCGTALIDLGQFEDALARFEQALAIEPGFADALYNRGNALIGLQRPEEALASFDQALALTPDDAQALNNRGNVLMDLGRPAEALASFDLALAQRPDDLAVLSNRGNTLRSLQRFEEALASFDQALALHPDSYGTLTNRAITLCDLDRPDEALASSEAALALKPDSIEALNSRGNALLDLRRPEDALASFDQALALDPGSAEALNNRGSALFHLGRLEEALAAFDQALALDPGSAEALNNRGNTLRELKRFEEALASFQQSLAINPGYAYAFNGAADCANKLCDWRVAGKIREEIIRKSDPVSIDLDPFLALSYCDDAALHYRYARAACRNFKPCPAHAWDGAFGKDGRLRISYVSADFRSHPVAHLIPELFERHDRSRFEVSGFSLGADDQSRIRARIIKSFDHFHDVRNLPDRAVAQLLKSTGTGIVIDLNGHTQDNRLNIFSFRPAPIQVNFLGYPGTTGADFIDYIIADKILIPDENKAFFSEAIAYLPDSYLINDASRMMSDDTPTRQQLGLPETGFVFCCFNSNWKITAQLFDVWMRLLKTTEGSVLWLLRDNAGAETNLRREAAERGVDPARLVFAGRALLEDHLARHRRADLFLDTLPYNAHMTAADALWAGLPVVTWLGKAFPARVAASVLTTIGLPELVTTSLEDYEMLALALARDPGRLQQIKAKLAQNRKTYPLFDAARFCRHIEAVYTHMWETWRRGEPASGFSVAALPGDATGAER